MVLPLGSHLVPRVPSHSSLFYSEKSLSMTNLNDCRISLNPLLLSLPFFKPYNLRQASSSIPSLDGSKSKATCNWPTSTANLFLHLHRHLPCLSHQSPPSSSSSVTTSSSSSAGVAAASSAACSPQFIPAVEAATTCLQSSTPWPLKSAGWSRRSSFNARCPLCRSEVTSTAHLATDHVVVLPHRQDQLGENMVTQVRDEVSNQTPGATAAAPSPSTRKKGRKHLKAGSLGDECIDVRSEKEEQFHVQLVRRSVSMDSSNDRQLHVSVQEILRQNPHHLQEAGSRQQEQWKNPTTAILLGQLEHQKLGTRSKDRCMTTNLSTASSCSGDGAST
ncbi:hypothetical protein B296_00046396 [Ensete ventricosum]|uniref:RING-type E3 ubiquitin transferase n=1 Tax=Ensete ventricosum TaxID=4639 RepID=A0A426X019_ENSVE|nr:hypothetical protein B296_00046396 [Ensete ventricosum]